MGSAKEGKQAIEGAPLALQVYLLGMVDFESLLRCQRRLHYEISGDSGQAALILCEHPPLITVGRHGSRAHIYMEPNDLQLRGMRLRWVNRAGGCWLHQPGQLSVYALLPLNRLGLSLPAYQQRLGQIVLSWLGDFGVRGDWHRGGAWVGNRLLAGLGFAVRNWVSYFGMCLNINPILDPYRNIRCTPLSSEPMTSLERERRGRLSPSMVRERFVDHFQKGFDFDRISLFTEHHSLNGSLGRSTTPRMASNK